MCRSPPATPPPAPGGRGTARDGMTIAALKPAHARHAHRRLRLGHRAELIIVHLASAPLVGLYLLGLVIYRLMKTTAS